MKPLALLSLTSLVVLFIYYPSAAQSKDLSVKEFEKAINQKDVQVLDVRTAEEYKTGFLQNALQANWNNKEEFAERTLALDKSKPVYVYCLAGIRGSAAAAQLADQGFRVYNLAGGIRAWQKEGKSVEAAQQLKQMTLSEYHALIPADKTVLVDIGAPWCPPCRKMTPLVDSLSTAAAGNWTLIRIDGSQHTLVADSLKADIFPSFIIYKNGKEVWRKKGMIAIEELAAQLP